MVTATLVLTGPPGAGKTTVGRLLAERLGVGLVDTDALVEQRAGHTIPEIFVEEGEEAFRVLERQAVADALARHDGIVSLGGGAILAPQTRELLAGARVVFLDLHLRQAVRRTGLDHGRPLLALNPRAAWLKLMEERRPFYEEVATVTIDTSELTPEQVADEIVARILPGEAR